MVPEKYCIDNPITISKVKNKAIEIKSLGGDPRKVLKWAEKKYRSGVAPIESYIDLGIEALKRGISTTEILEEF